MGFREQSHASCLRALSANSTIGDVCAMLHEASLLPRALALHVRLSSSRVSLYYYTVIAAARYMRFPPAAPKNDSDENSQCQ